MEYFKRLITQKPELILFGIFGSILILKYFFITNLDNDQFLYTYKFMSSDSFDWLANGIRLFTNDSISFRNPGLPLVINVLYSLNALYLLPLINQFVYILIAVYIYKICKQIVTKKFSLLVTILFLVNYSFNIGANMILADYYAVLLITASVYYLLIKKYWLSFFSLFSSLIFQNAAVVLIPLWIINTFINYRINAIELIRKRDFKAIFVNLILFSFSAIPLVIWFCYRMVMFGNLLYSNVSQIELINPHLESILFYFVNSIVLFSPLVLIIVIYYLFKPEELLKNRLLGFLFAGLVINIIFWVILYDWNDRRFLVYFFPWIYPLIAYFLSVIKIRFLYLVLILFIIFYPSTLPVTSLLAGNEFPLVHNIYLDSTFDGIKMSSKVTKRDNITNPLMNLNPILYNSLVGSDYYRNSDSTWFTFYSEHIQNNFDSENLSLCLDKDRGFKKYQVASVLLIHHNVDLDDIVFTNCTDPVNE